MKRLFKLLFIIVLFIPFFVFAKEKEMNIYLFYGSGCPHCRDLENYLDGYLKENDFLKIYRYEVWDNKENASKLKDIAQIYKTDHVGVPYLIVGSSVIIGFDEEITPEKIQHAVNYYSKVCYEDKAGKYLGLVDENQNCEEESVIDDTERTLPIIGKIDVKNVSLLLVASVIGLVDGFNPCAMWILLFLISMLLSAKDRKRRYSLGIAFLVASALVYFLFLISWLNLAELLNKIIYIRLAIAMAAICFGFYSIVNYINNINKDVGCEVVDSKNRKRIVKSIKKTVNEDIFILALIGIVLLAFSVNVIELLCSLGLPIMFSEILTINEVSNTSKIIYSLVYVFFFMIDDIIVFIIAMKTLEIKAVSNTFGKYAHLVGGLIMLIIGLLMIYKPEWLMLNF